jgi:hypothetical protein
MLPENNINVKAMIPQFQKLSVQEQEQLMNAPVLFSVLASCSDNMINKAQKADAIKLAHIRTFTAMPMLQPYFKEVEIGFKEHFEAVAAQFYPFDDAHRDLLKMEISKVEDTIRKLDHSYGTALSKSLERYANHIKRATYSIYQDFMFPIAILGLNHRS